VFGNWTAACPVCGADLGPFAAAASLPSLPCRSCRRDWPSVDGIWQLVHPHREREVDRFLADYVAIRLSEGRSGRPAGWYTALPSVGLDDPLAEEWRMRAVTWRHVEARVVAPLAAALGRELDVVDLGAGTGWLSHRLRRIGQRPISVDVNTDLEDGLAAAARHLTPDWPVVQAHFDHLPLPDASADVAIFNASFHYSTDPVATLREARRVLRPDGLVVVIDSPIYRREHDGELMVRERWSSFVMEYGLRAERHPSIGFLTPDRLDRWGEALGIEWRTATPWYGWRWALRPAKARMRRRRRPSRFRVVIGRPVSAARARS
jgi:SAM-dependent methyltransferase